MAKPDTRATTAPTSVAELGRRFGSPHPVQEVWRAEARRNGIGSVGPAVA